MFVVDAKWKSQFPIFIVILERGKHKNIDMNVKNVQEKTIRKIEKSFLGMSGHLIQSSIINNEDSFLNSKRVNCMILR